MFRIENLFDYLLICLILILIAVSAYHPFYWGDELEPWRLVEKHIGDFNAAFWEYCQYKPRFLFSAIWIGLAAVEASRIWGMIAMLLGEVIAAFSIFYLVSRTRPERRIVAWAAVLAFISSRFGIVIWYDYLSGVIETLSFAFFISGICILASSRDIKLWQIIFGMGLLLCAVFVHERYIPAVILLGICLAIFHFDFKGNKVKLIIIIALSILPGILFFIANAHFGKNSIAMGTAGRVIALNSETFLSFITYIFNVLFQTNFGLDWFVGSLSWNHYNGKIMSIISAILFACIYCCHVFHRNRIFNKKLLAICSVSALALIFVASLPGLERQEGRWMYPVLGLVIIASTTLFSERVLILFLTSIICTNGFYMFSGSLNSIANVVASRTAQSIGVSIKTFSPLSKYGVIVGEGSTNWVINAGQPDGHLFSLANSLSGVRLDSSLDPFAKVDNRYGFVLASDGQDKNHVPLFKMMSMSAAQVLLNAVGIMPNIEAKEEVIGGANLWSQWRLAENMVSGDRLLVDSGKVGFTDLPISKIDGKILIYSAESESESAIPMRIQINWIDTNNNFISAYIKVVSVTPGIKQYSALVSAPSNATRGLVYVSLHGETVGKIWLSKVSVLKVSDF